MPESIQEGGHGKGHWSKAGPAPKDWDHKHSDRVV